MSLFIIYICLIGLWWRVKKKNRIKFIIVQWHNKYSNSLEGLVQHLKLFLTKSKILSKSIKTYFPHLFHTLNGIVLFQRIMKVKRNDSIWQTVNTQKVANSDFLQMLKSGHQGNSSTKTTNFSLVSFPTLKL